MRFLPVVDRELRVAGRQARTYWRRCGVALISIAVGGLGWLTSYGAPPANLGFDLFVSMSVIALIYCLLAGLLTADALSGEKREGTLGLLFLTDLRGYDVVLGKLVATALHAFFGLLALFPVLAVSFLLGGVTLRGLVQMAAVLLNTLFFSLSAGMGVSALSRHERKAAGGTLLLILFVSLGVPFLGLMDAIYWHPRTGERPHDLFLVPSPLCMFFYGVDSTSVLMGVPPRSLPREFVWSFVAVHVEAWACLILACAVAPRAWRDRPGGARFPRWHRFWANWIYGSPEERRSFRTRLLDVNPVCWLSSRERWKVPVAWGTIALAVAGWLIGYYKLRGPWLEMPVSIAFAVILHAIFKGWLATEVCRRFAEDRHSGALELLVSTPLSVGRIVRGQWMALRRVYGGPLVALVVIDLLLLLAGLQDINAHASRREFVYLFLAGIVVLVADFFTLALVGMWYALSSKSYNRAVGLTMNQILIGPWLVFGAVAAVVAVVGDQRGWSPPQFPQVLAGWFALMLFIDAVSAAWSGHQLLHRFRLMATQRFQPRELRGWRRWLRVLGPPRG